MRMTTASEVEYVDCIAVGRGTAKSKPQLLLVIDFSIAADVSTLGGTPFNIQLLNSVTTTGTRASKFALTAEIPSSNCATRQSLEGHIQACIIELIGSDWYQCQEARGEPPCSKPNSPEQCASKDVARLTGTPPALQMMNYANEHHPMMESEYHPEVVTGRSLKMSTGRKF